MGKKLNILLLMGLLLHGCSMKYDNTVADASISQEIPDSTLKGFEQVKVKNALPEYKITAERAEIYQKKEETYLINVNFTEYDKNKNIITTGTAKKVLYYTKDENAVLEGELDFYSRENKVRIEGEELTWDSGERTLTGTDEHTVTITEDSGSVMEGAGFSIDFKTSIIKFTKPVEGIVKDEKED